MSQGWPAGARRRAVIVAAVLVVVAGIAAAVPRATRTGGRLVSADPPAGSTVAVAPTDVMLTFSEDVQPELSHMNVVSAAGVGVAGGQVWQPEPRQLRLPVQIGAAGDFTVVYHVILNDGTAITGEHRFSVSTGATPAPLDPERDVAAHEHTHGIDGLSATLLVADGVVLFGVLVLLWRRPRDQRMVAGSGPEV